MPRPFLLTAILISIASVAAVPLEKRAIPVAFASGVRRRVIMMGSGVPSPEGMPILPPGVVKYSQVPAEGKGKGGFFTHTSIPKGLLNQHTTKKGTWGVIRVNRGKLLYEIEEPKMKKFELTPDCPPGIIEPTKPHRVESMSEDLEFCVEFHRLPGTGPVDEKRE